MHGINTLPWRDSRRTTATCPAHTTNCNVDHKTTKAMWEPPSSDQRLLNCHRISRRSTQRPDQCFLPQRPCRVTRSALIWPGILVSFQPFRAANRLHIELSTTSREDFRHIQNLQIQPALINPLEFLASKAGCKNLCIKRSSPE
jgi:hypothetical protein